MICERYEINIEGQKTGAATLSVYCQEPLVEGEKRRAVLIIPGGGYRNVSKKEGEPFAMFFAAMGYDAFVLHYSVAPNVYPTALRETEAAFDLIRAHAAEWQLDADKLFLMGFSAGGHLALDYAVERTADMVKPAGLVLCYPVVSSGTFAHRGSFDNLLADRSGADAEELLAKLSLENQLEGKELPPVFLWSTWTDGSVPVENTLLLAAALKRAGVSTELHVFKEGVHGLALATAVTSEGNPDKEQAAAAQWTALLKNWLEQL